MKLFSYRQDGTVRAGVVIGDGALDLAVLEQAGQHAGDDAFAEALHNTTAAPIRLIDFLSSGPRRKAELETVLARASTARSLSDALTSLDSIEFAIPTPGSSKILCVGRNYLEHINESNREVPGAPVIFCRYENSLVAHKEAIERPVVSEELDWEGELAAVIGFTCRYVSEKDALDVLAGYSIFNDGSVRDYQHHTVQWTPGKNFPASGSYGPYLVTPEAIPDPQALDLETWVNGASVQKANTSAMIFSLRRLISYISQWTELHPGDVIATGTPAGIGAARTPKWFLKAGDELSISISGLGILTNSVVDEVHEPDASAPSVPKTNR